MTFKIITTMALAVSVLAISTASQAGGKRHGGGFNKHGHGGYHGGYHRRHHWNGGHGYYNPDNCHFYFRKARYTGSHHWWNKYRRCISRY